MDVEHLRVVDHDTEEGEPDPDETDPKFVRVRRFGGWLASRNWRQILTTLGEIIGICLISGGLAMKWPWIGVVMSGVLLILFSVATSLPTFKAGDDG